MSAFGFYGAAAVATRIMLIWSSTSMSSTHSLDYYFSTFVLLLKNEDASRNWHVYNLKNVNENCQNKPQIETSPSDQSLWFRCCHYLRRQPNDNLLIEIDVPIHIISYSLHGFSVINECGFFRCVSLDTLKTFSCLFVNLQFCILCIFNAGMPFSLAVLEWIANKIVHYSLNLPWLMWIWMNF